MTEYWSKTHSFFDGATRLSDLVYFTLIQDDLDDDEISHTILVALDGKDWYQLTHVNWKSVGVEFVTSPDEIALCLGELGQTLTYFGGKEGTEKFGYAPKLLRNLSIIDGECFACGMNREVYRRIGAGHWQAMAAPVPKKGETLGFEDISGFSAGDLYAVGWEGEIWHFNDGDWSNCSSPVNMILSGVCCASDGFVYVCGQEGTLLKGRGDVWKTIVVDEFRQDLWDIVEFNNTIYVASKTSVFELIDDDLAMSVVESDEIKTAGRFSERDGTLWSVGLKDVFRLDDSGWTRVE